ncbi:hypothetical protein Cpin_4652 [Chitinophaga pinensis DSM 2588]|uniref:Uncharacterized protein n=1 Tax=Chitinophaga pinensis (strain ATCC 43595 / DSM 2588 / LMG 13176 / NBRC 15968 / NCIMB 11800 / UQM 2034) TaxID=485918 RepID=A0A979GWZ9_CHIPD|nr:hypothetical protein Cpin_4652 [Chitinophaga pinensis DSM 2588]
MKRGLLTIMSILLILYGIIVFYYTFHIIVELLTNFSNVTGHETVLLIRPTLAIAIGILILKYASKKEKHEKV